MSPFVATIARSVGVLLRMARWLGSSRRTTRSFESSARMRTEGTPGSMVATRTDWTRPPVVRMEPWV